MAVEITRTPSSNGNQKTWTFSVWLKGQDVTSGTAQNILSAFYGSSSRYANINITSTYTLEVFSGVYSTGGSTTTSAYLVTNRVFRDPSAWWNIVVAYDTTNATSGDRVKIYINGVRETSFSTETYPSLNDDSFFNVTTTQNRIGASGGANVYKGLMTHMHFIDGTAYDASTFGETDATTGIWKPITEPSVTYGTNGFFLKFENSANMDLDSSPNNLTFSTSGTLTQTVDTPSNNFATLNALENTYSSFTLTNGNLKAETTSASYSFLRSTLGVSTGKWYTEVKCTAQSGSINKWLFGISDSPSTSSTNYIGVNSYQYGWMGEGSTIFYNGTSASYGSSTMATGDIIGIALDLDNNKLYWSKNGTWINSANPETNTNGFSIVGSSSTNTGFYHFAFGEQGDNTSYTFECNFGNGYFGITAVASAGSNGNGAIFEYDCPSGYYALNTKNINTYG